MDVSVKKSTYFACYSYIRTSRRFLIVPTFVKSRTMRSVSFPEGLYKIYLFIDLSTNTTVSELNCIGWSQIAGAGKAVALGARGGRWFINRGPLPPPPPSVLSFNLGAGACKFCVYLFLGDIPYFVFYLFSSGILGMSGNTMSETTILSWIISSSESFFNK